MSTSRKSMKDLVGQLQTVAHSPTGMQKAGLSFLSEVLDGKIDLVDATNPLVYLMEVSAANTAAGTLGYRQGLKYSYSSLSKDMKDLHRFMSDHDFDEIHALPGTAMIKVSISVESLMEYGVTDPVTGSTSLRIPKDTFITVDGVELAFTKPVTIKQFSNDAYIVYEELPDGTKNVLNHELQSNDTELSWIDFHIITKHLHIRTLYLTMVRSQYFSKTIEYLRDYHKVEVQYKLNGVWTNLNLSYHKDLQDLNTPTAIITVRDSKIEVSIARHYLESGTLGDDIKIVVYTTGGELYKLRTVNSDEIKISYRRLDNDTSLNAEEEPLPSATVVMVPLTPVENSRKELTFEELKTAVNSNNIGRNMLPVTRGDLGFSASKVGYTLFQAIDILTERQYIAGKHALSPIGYNNDFSTPLDVCNRRINISYDGLKDVIGVKTKVNESWLSIPAGTLFSIDTLSGNIKPSTLRTNLETLSLKEKISLLDENPLYYTPYTLTVYYDDPSVTITPYRTDRPEVKSLYVKDRNVSTPSTINAYTTSMKYVDDYFVLQVTTKSTGELHDMTKAEMEAAVVSDLSFTSGPETVYYEGVLLSKTDDGEFLYEFKIPTKLKLKDDTIVLLDSATESVEYLTGIISDFRLTYRYITAPAGFITNSSIDGYIPANSGGLSHSLLNIEFASIVTYLWNHVTTIKTGAIYETHSVNVPYINETDIYERGDDGVIIGTAPDCSGTVIKIGDKGDPVVKDGNIVYKHLEGSVVRGPLGAKVLNTPIAFTHFLDVVLIDARGLFSNNPNIDTYRRDMEDKLYRDATTNLEPLIGLTRAKTTINFKPISTTGVITAATEFSREVVINSQVDMKLELSVGSSIFTSETSKEAIKKKVISIITEYYTREMLAKSELIAMIREKIGEPLIDVSITKFMNGNNVVSVIDDSYAFSIKKSIVPISDYSYDLVDDVDIVFKNFDIS